MISLARRAEEYLTIRRALGYKLTGYDAVLGEFTDWLDAREATVVTADLAVVWVTRLRPTTSPVRQRQLLTMVRCFAEYLHAVDPRTEVPTKDLLPARHERKAPYLYSSAELAALMAAARSLVPPLKAATYETLIGLLACTALRFGEAAGLDRTDVNLAEADLLVRFGKNGRSRHVPIHQTTVAALSAYAAERDRLCPQPAAPSFFVSVRGRRLAHSSTHAVFTTLRHTVGLDATGTGRPPRIHDLRHGFIVGTMLAWHREGVDVQARLPVLSTYVGHVDPKATYWYQQAAPELLALAARRLEAQGGDE
jgi:integrase/recombinase XerD